MTDEQLYTLRHMLGINDPTKANPVPYRDRYCAIPGDPFMAELERVGAVRLVNGPTEHLPYEIYCCTDAGRAAAIASYTTIRYSKSKRVYRKFLSMRDVCPDLTFKQFLTDPEFAETRRAA